MKKARTVSLLTVILLVTTSSVCQNSNPLGSNFKNSIYGEIGVGVISYNIKYAFYSIQYERIIAQQLVSQNSSSFIRIGLGQMYNMDQEQSRFYSKIHFGSLLGTNANKLELSVGLVYLDNLSTWDKNDLHLSGSIGWRYQRPGNNFFFRTGTGYPDFFYISIGWSF